MDGSSSEIKISANIIQALTEICELEGLKGALAKDFEGVFQQLEGIPEEVIRIIINGVDEVGLPIQICIKNIQEVVAIILKQHLQNNLPALEILEKKLHTSLNKAPLSLGSLRLIEKYLQGFCKKYPPERIPDWENPTDANDEYHGYNHDDYQTWKHSWEGHESVPQEDVGKNEKMTLLRAIKAIQHSILHIDSLIPHGDCLHTEKTQKHLGEELSRIKSIQQSLNTFRDMKEWGNNHTPYRALCTHGEPLGPNLFHESFIDVVETITRWERVCDRLNIHKKKT